MDKRERFEQVTVWRSPRAQIHVGSGRFVAYSEWLERERVRILRSPGRHAEVRTRGERDEVALFVD